MKNKFDEENGISRKTHRANPLQSFYPIHHAARKAFQQQPKKSTALPHRIKSGSFYETRYKSQTYVGGFLSLVSVDLQRGCLWNEEIIQLASSGEIECFNYRSGCVKENRVCQKHSIVKNCRNYERWTHRTLRNFMGKLGAKANFKPWGEVFVSRPGTDFRFIS